MRSVSRRGRSVARMHQHAPKAPNRQESGRRTGFVVWLIAPGGSVQGFITWAETAVAELSPAIKDAWQFPNIEAANDSVVRAFGAHAEGYGVAIFPARQCPF